MLIENSSLKLLDEGVSPIDLAVLPNFVVPESINSPPFEDRMIITENPFLSQNSSDRHAVAIFYNIFANAALPDVAEAEATVSEQLQQIGESYAATSNDLTIYYNTVGHVLLFGESFAANVQKQCTANGLKCVHMEHHRAGYEEITLQKAYEFCKSFPYRNVIYMHNKGSYSSGRWNIPWRRHMMRAITSGECLRNMDQCTTCGLLFQPMWTFFFPGNFFVSRCDYINRLIPPKDFEVRVNEMLEQRPNELLGLIFEEWESTLGRRRYSMEHWIGTHPSFVPCHLSTEPSIRTWTLDEGLPFSFATASHLPIESRWFQAKVPRMKKILDDESSRKRDWFLLPGLLYKWYVLYQEYPPQSSWIWEYFPDGREWYNSIRKDTNATAVLQSAWQKTPASDQWIEMVASEMDRREQNRLALWAKEARLQRRRESQRDATGI
ncbi:hypothetical protein FisN_8Hh394 [Fistulifera solaris]|uniref:Uncharacterized protein n=1 Tax=Fistulifera solaris TaxID=1519565 RepID=A0A1Z5JMV3_FISSO|nr:hypothetical protein FisN_8Hh394 [Fistulifera solaris]|eukprot:GAX15309.1 hypothetical protein FisN_8Hh394 [Fistulifera solaris]